VSDARAYNKTHYKNVKSKRITTRYEQSEESKDLPNYLRFTWKSAGVCVYVCVTLF